MKNILITTNAILACLLVVLGDLSAATFCLCAAIFLQVCWK